MAQKSEQLYRQYVVLFAALIVYFFFMLAVLIGNLINGASIALIVIVEGLLMFATGMTRFSYTQAREEERMAAATEMMREVGSTQSETQPESGHAMEQAADVFTDDARPPGWYHDKQTAYKMRYWDGGRWND